ncbi:uncharacterized protein [Nicotiana tomentosiformis]|uniref:uncharacterized protein n=1 Tax=Nicotiana tomentosiformis TaxID=4098 RepID=UPI00388C44FD
MWPGNNQTSVISVDEQQITIKIQNGVKNSNMFVTAVYAKCNANERKDLWSSLEGTHMVIDGPWFIGGDFNIILDLDEKRGGRPHRMYKNLDFSSCMDNCEVKDLGYVGPKFTWCNNWDPRRRIWKRFDRIFPNDLWCQLLQNNIVKHLPRIGSDHRPLLLSCHNRNNNGIKYFRFLDFWTEQPTFMNLVEEVWATSICGNALWKLQQKLKMLSKRLTQWFK